MDIPNHADLLTGIETFCRRHDMAETRFGRDAINNPNFIRGLRDGVSPTLDTLTKVRDFMARTNEEALTRAKLAAPLEPALAAEEEVPLPFAAAPASQAGATSPTSSSTRERPTPRPESDSSRSTPTANRSCSTADAK